MIMRDDLVDSRSRQKWIVGWSVLILGGLLVFLGITARTLVTTFQNAERQVLLSSRSRELHYEFWSITIPSTASIIILLAAICWLTVKVFRKKWEFRCLLAILFYGVAFIVFQWFLVTLEFEAFD